MKLPRDLSGRELLRALGRFGYEFVRQEGSHMRLMSRSRGHAHFITIPDHRELKAGTLRAMLRRVANYLQIDSENLSTDLFGN